MDKYVPAYPDMVFIMPFIQIIEESSSGNKIGIIILSKDEEEIDKCSHSFQNGVLA